MSLPKPYYDEDGIMIYHADCREILPHLPKVDLVLTDPPYGIGKDGQKPSDGKHGGRKAYEFLGWDGQRPTEATFSMLLASGYQHIIWGGQLFCRLSSCANEVACLGQRATHQPI